jgi:hypothetical protein
MLNGNYINVIYNFDSISYFPLNGTFYSASEFIDFLIPKLNVGEENELGNPYIIF